MSNYTPAKFEEDKFHCPNCGTYAEQIWSIESVSTYQYKKANGSWENSAYRLYGLNSAQCSYCENFSLWLNKEMIYPISGNVEQPNSDLSEDIVLLYNEAKKIVNLSPRGASALLRLALQKLCIELGEKGKNINDDIASLVKKGLPATIQKALDTIRVVGNNAVHPGQIDFDDKLDVAFVLFKYINIIANHFITIPKSIDEGYELLLPQKDKENIEKRDS
ncbi:MAG: DUF4145 domain-containing protein [Chitinophagales bacterium]|nr:DUF4145 domain-containing protein [Chitinophagales bacterium]